MRRRFLIALGIVLAGSYVAFGLSRIRFDVDITRLLPENLKEAEGARLFLDHYSRQGELMVTLEADDADTADEAVESLSEVFRGEKSLVSSVVNRPAWETEEGGEEMLEFIAWALINRPASEMEALERSLAPGEIDKKLEDSLEQLATGVSPEGLASLEYDPLGFLGGGFIEAAGSMGDASEFASRDGRFRVLYVAAKEPEVSYREKIAWIEAMREVVSKWEESAVESGGGKVKIGFTGEPAFVAEISGGMEGDMRRSAAVTLAVIGLIFWFAYRRFRPLLDLVAALVVIFVLTLATGGILFRELSAISIGFASILIGLTVDYGVILYQEARVTGGSVAKVRRSAGRGILWASLTTAAAFGSLAAGTMPGLSELGILVGAGVLLGAAVMFGGFTYRAVAAGKREFGETAGAENGGGEGRDGVGVKPDVAAWVTGVAIVFLLGVLVVEGAPEIDSSPAALRPRDSSAQEAMDRLAERLGDSDGPVSVIVSARDLASAGEKLREIEAKLRELQGDDLVESFGLPTAIWPVPEVQQKNLEGGCQRLVESRERLRLALDEAGFEESAFAFAGSILDFWAEWKEAGGYPVWPEANSARRVVSRFLDWNPEGESGSGVWGLGLLLPAEPGNREDLMAIRQVLDLDGVYLSGGNMLSTALAEVVPASVGRIFVVLSVLVFLALLIAFRRVKEVVLTVISVGVTIAAMLGAMQLFGVSWNFMNLAALLLALGAGLDYAIHMLIDLRRHDGDVRAVQGGVGRALLVCGVSSVAGFGSLAWAGNLGLASLGQACALALAINTAVAVFLLPKVWAWFPGGDRGASLLPPGA